MEYNPYAEDPRPNLYNIVKNTKENKVRITLGCKLILARLHEDGVRCQNQRGRDER